jgi:hypothetical protein
MNDLSFVRDLNLRLIAVLRQELGLKGTGRVRWLLEKRKPSALEASIARVVEVCERSIWTAENVRKAVEALMVGAGKVLYWHPGQLYFPARFLSRYGLIANTILFQDLVSLVCVMKPSFEDYILKKPLLWAAELLDRAAFLCSLETWVARNAVLFYPPLPLWAPIRDLSSVDAMWYDKSTEEERAELQKASVEHVLRLNLKSIALVALNRTPNLLDMDDSTWEQAAISKTAEVLSVPEDQVREVAKLRPLVAPMKRLALYGKDASYIAATSLTVGQALFLGVLWGCVPLSDSPVVRLTLDVARKHGARFSDPDRRMVTPSLDFLNDVPNDFALALRPTTQALRDELYQKSDPETFMRGYERFREGWKAAQDSAVLKFGLRGAMGFGTFVHGALELNAIEAALGVSGMVDAFVERQGLEGELARNPFYALLRAEQKAAEYRNH